MPKAWVIRAGPKDERADWALEHGRAGGGWRNIPDLTADDTESAVDRSLAEIDPHRDARLRRGLTYQLWCLRGRIQTGDVVAMPLRRHDQIVLGEVIGGYAYDLGEDDMDLRHTVDVRWDPQRVPFAELDGRLLDALTKQFDVYEVADSERLIALRDRAGPEAPPAPTAMAMPVETVTRSAGATWLMTVGAFVLAAAVGRLMDFVAPGWVITITVASIVVLTAARLRRVSRRAPLVRNLIAACVVAAICCAAIGTIVPPDFEIFMLLGAGTFATGATLLGRPPYEPVRTLIFAGATGLAIATTVYTLILIGAAVVAIVTVFISGGPQADLSDDFLPGLLALIFVEAIFALGYGVVLALVSAWLIVGSLKWFTVRSDMPDAVDNAQRFFVLIVVPNLFAIILQWDAPSLVDLWPVRTIATAVLATGVLILISGFIVRRWLYDGFVDRWTSLRAWLQRQTSTDEEDAFDR